MKKRMIKNLNKVFLITNLKLPDPREAKCHKFQCKAELTSKRKEQIKRKKSGTKALLYLKLKLNNPLKKKLLLRLHQKC